MTDTTESPSNAQQRLLEELLVFFDPVVRAAQDPNQAYALIRATGWTPGALLGPSGDKFPGAVSATASAVEEVQRLLKKPPQSLADLEAALSQVRRAVDALQALPAAMGTARPPELEKLPSELLEVLGLMYLQRRAESLLPVLRALTIVRTESIEPVANAEGLVRPGGSRERLDLVRISALLSDPVGQLKNHYLPEGLTNAVAANEAAARLLPPLAGVFQALGAYAVVGRGDSVPQAFPSQEAVLARTMTAMWQLPIEPDEGDGVEGAALGLGITLRLVAADEGGPGLLLSPFGQAVLVLALTEAWRLTLGADATVDAALITRTAVKMPSSPFPLARIGLDTSLEKLSPQDEPAVRVGSVSGTRLEVGRLRFSAGGDFDARQQSFGLLLEATSGELVVVPGDGDGFLQQILPRDGLRTAIDLALGWSSERGLYIRGGAGLDATLPVNRDVAGLLKIHTISLGLRADGAGLRAEAGVAVSVQLGPVAVAVEGMGVLATVAFPPGGGNAGLAELHLRFKPPTGAGLSINAGVVKGGGFLLFDPEKEQYVGAVQLELAKTIRLTAFGLLSTRMPDGRPGFSLLILMSALFSPPMQLPYGFTLRGVGGLIGVNRTVAVDILRGGLRAGSLGSVLFPVDPIRNAPQIVSDLQAIFPPANGRFLIGPMVQLGWGTPTLLTIDLGLILELPEPVRLLILGRLKVMLPEESHPIVSLQLDALGVIDFASGDVALDAVLYDSRIAQFAVTGAMAVRANFGAKPNFVLAIGGFNPRFPAPAGFPALDRVAISLGAGNNVRLRLEAYLALTTNTVQFGARLELYARAGDFSVDGLLGFDVLMQLDPFGFIADVGAAVALKYNGRSLMSVGLQLALTGPSPWYARGTASFTVWFISGSIPIEVRVGPAEKPPPPLPVDVQPLLVTALSDLNNWTTQVPNREHPIVALRDRPGATEQFVHPLADLSVKQRVAPLRQRISRFGGSRPKQASTFTLGVIGKDGSVRWMGDKGVEAVKDHFAPAQFRNMSDDEKLTAPAFESMDAGIRIVTSDFDYGKPIVEPEIIYACTTINRAGQRVACKTDNLVGQADAMEPTAAMTDIGVVVGPEPPVVAVVGPEPLPGPEPIEVVIGPEPQPIVVAANVAIDAAFVRQVAGVRAAAQAPLAPTGADYYAAPDSGVSLRPPTFAVVKGHGLAATIVPEPETTATKPKPVGTTTPQLVGTRPPPTSPDGGVVEPSSYSSVAERQVHLETLSADRARLRVVPVYVGIDA